MAIGKSFLPAAPEWRKGKRRCWIDASTRRFTAFAVRRVSPVYTIYSLCIAKLIVTGTKCNADDNNNVACAGIWIIRTGRDLGEMSTSLPWLFRSRSNLTRPDRIVL
jgi:hypothetical protein